MATEKTSAEPDQATATPTGTPAPEDEAVEKVRRGRSSGAPPAEFDSVLREALGRIAAEGRLSGGHVVNFFGSVDVGGDMSMGRRSGREKPDVITVDVAAELRLFVPPPDLEHAGRVLGRGGIVVLSGPEGSGKRLAALALASRHGTRINYARPRRSLAELSSLRLETGAAYVVVDLAVAAAAEIDDHWLEAMSALLTKAGSTLVITVSRPAPLRRAGLRGERLIEPFRPPDVAAVVRELATRTCPAEAADALAALLEHDEVTVLLSATRTPYAARRIADALLEVATGVRELGSALRMLADPGPRMADWFATNADPASHAFVIAAAVLQGASFPAVADAALDLRDRANRRPAAIDLNFRSMLAGHPEWIVVVPSTQDTGYGPVPVEVVRFADPSDRFAALRYAFDNFDQLRRPLMAWLHNLGAEPQPVSVRAQAAATAGQLAVWDLPYCLHHLVVPWAAAESADVRQVAMLALTVCGSNGTHAGQIWELLEHWCADAGGNLTLTAVGALGGSLGARDTATAQVALAGLRRVAERGDWNFVPDIAGAVLALATAGRLPTVLTALLSWTRTDQAGSARVTGLLSFLTVAANCGAPRPGLGWWPALLTEEPALRRTTVTLWARALDARQLRVYALEVLRTWFDQADMVLAARSVLGTIVGEIARQDSRQDERLTYWIHKWATDPKRPSPAAAELIGGTEEA